MLGVFKMNINKSTKGADAHTIYDITFHKMTLDDLQPLTKNC